MTALGALGCGATTAPPGQETAPAPPAGTGGELSGRVTVDGSSTVFPITQAVAEEFQAIQPGVTVTVGVSGTGGGFDKFCRGETDISNASRPIKDSEKEACAAKGIEWLELEVAFDGLSLLVNPQNDFVECLTLEELEAIWQPDSTVRTWQDVRPEWPAEPIGLYAPGTDSGTFDYFTEAVMGEEGASRSDYTASEDDNVLVQGVSGDSNALGYFGYAYYVENQGRLKLVAVDGGSSCVEPTPGTIESGEYPLARPIFIYPSRQALERPEMAAFVEYYLSDEGMDLVPQVGYIRISEESIEASRQALGEALP